MSPGRPAAPLTLSALCAGESEGSSTRGSLDSPPGPVHALQTSPRQHFTRRRATESSEPPSAPTSASPRATRSAGAPAQTKTCDQAEAQAPTDATGTDRLAGRQGARRGAQLSLKGQALRLLAGREHSRAELERKLAKYEPEPQELARILDELQAKGFIDESRVIESVLHRRAERLGSARIAHELRSKGLAPEAIAQTLSDLQASELERARALWARKFGLAPQEPPGPKDPKEQARQMRFLLARGFSAEVVRRVVGGEH